MPIWDGYQRKTAIERQQLNVESQSIALERTKQQLKSDVQNAIASSRAARKQYDAAQKTFDATDIAYVNTTKRHALGTINTLDLTTARNNRDIAENDLVVAKYDYVFKLKILDFYLGKPLNLNN